MTALRRRFSTADRAAEARADFIDAVRADYESGWCSRYAHAVYDAADDAAACASILFDLVHGRCGPEGAATRIADALDGAGYLLACNDGRGFPRRDPAGSVCNGRVNRAWLTSLLCEDDADTPADRARMTADAMDDLFDNRLGAFAVFSTALDELLASDTAVQVAAAVAGSPAVFASPAERPL